MKIAVAADHGGFKLKNTIKKYLISNKFDVKDLGTYSEDSVDYPDYGFKAGECIAAGKCDRAIIVCGTGIGVAIAANKIPGARAALCHSVEYARLSREHNDANILALGGRFLDENTALEIVQVWLSTEFEGGRHQRRVDKLNKYQYKSGDLR